MADLTKPLECTLGDTITYKNEPLLMNAITAYLEEQGFEEETLPELAVLKLFVTFCATVAVRAQLGKSTKLRSIVKMWDKVMLNYVTSRVAHDPSALMKNEETNLPREDESLIVGPGGGRIIQ